MNMTARIILILVICASLCTACGQAGLPLTTSPTATPQPTEAPPLDRDVEESEVYSAMLNGAFMSDRVGLYLIVDHTRVNNPGLLEQDLENFQKDTPLETGLVEDFLAVNQQPSALEPLLDIDLPYQLFTQEEIDELHPLDKESGWQLFDEKFPNAVGFLYLSRVGFNADLSQALVYYERYMYDIPVSGGYYLLTRQDGQWVIESGYEWIT